MPAPQSWGSNAGLNISCVQLCQPSFGRPPKLVRLHCKVCQTICSHMLCPVPVQGSPAFTGFAKFSPNGALMASGGHNGAVALRPGTSMDAATRQVPVHDGGQGKLAAPVTAMFLLRSFWEVSQGHCDNRRQTTACVFICS